MMIDLMNLVDFSDLYVIAVGLSMAYVVIEGRQSDRSFFSILANFTSVCQAFALNRKTKPQQKEEAVITQVKYYLNSAELDDKIKGAMDLICQKAEEVIALVKDLEKWIKRKLVFHTKTDFLNVISCYCTLFGVVMLFIGALQNKCKLNCDGLIEWLILGAFVCLLHCLIYERLEIDNDIKKYTRPTISRGSVLFLIFLCIGAYRHDTLLIDVSHGWLTMSTVFVCFMGFVAYLLTTIVASVCLLIVSLYKISRLDINTKVNGQKEDIERYMSALTELDERFKNENLDGYLSIHSLGVAKTEM